MRAKNGRGQHTSQPHGKKENNHAMERFGTNLTLIVSITTESWHACDARDIMICFQGLIPQTLGPPTSATPSIAIACYCHSAYRVRTNPA
jgi:hypothetical protein